MINGELAIPWNGQSLARPDDSFSNVACHRNSPVASRKAITTPRSPACLGSRLSSLLVPMMTTPPPTDGLPYDCDPRSSTHFPFFPDLTSHSVGAPVIGDTMLRDGVPPHMGQSFAESATVTLKTRAKVIACRMVVDSRGAHQALGSGP